jgi:hypothetical protein
MRHSILTPIMIFMTRYYLNNNFLRRFPSVSRYFKKILLPVIFLPVIFIAVSCEEGATTIGTAILPESDFVTINSIDTLSVRSYTMYADSVQTDSPSVSFLGNVYDPYFGTTTGEFVTQLRLGSSWIPGQYTIDSVKLILNLLTVTGDVSSDAGNTLKISEIADQIYTTSKYYSNTEVPVTKFSIDSIPLPVLKADTANIVAIDIPVRFGYYITRDTTQFFYSNTKPDFRTYFKGLYFQMLSAGKPLVVSLSLASSSALGSYNNFFVIYMHDPNGVKSEYYLIIDAKNANASFNRYLHDYNTAEPDKKISHINDGYLDTLSYLQNLNGVYTKIDLPGLADLKKDPDFLNGLAVNKARLTVPVYYDGNIFKPTTVPVKLLLRYRTKDGTKYVLPDYSLDVYHTYFDGTLDVINGVYNFNIGAYVQGYLRDETGDLSPSVEVFQSSGTKNVILKANNNKKPPKFEFTYTRF